MQPSLFERARQASRPDDPFDAAWKQWPRKDGKEYARQCFKKALRFVTLEELQRAVSSYVAKSAGTDKQFIPHFSTWLNRKRWADEETPEVRQDREQAIWEARAAQIKKRFRSTSLGPTEARGCLARGLITAEDARAYGVMV